MISRVTLPGRLSATSVGSLRNTEPKVSPRSVWTTTLSPILSQRLRELRKKALRAPRSATWTMSDIVGPLWGRRAGPDAGFGAGESIVTTTFPGGSGGRAGYDHPRPGPGFEVSTSIPHAGRVFIGRPEWPNRPLKSR